MSRCKERHPRSHKRCLLDAGHEGAHDPEPHTPAEREVISESISRDGMKLVTKWCHDNHPPVAIAAGLLALYRQVSDMREVSHAGQIRELICMMAGRSLSKLELFAYLAEELGVSCEVLRVGNEEMAS